jgi:ubiquinone/menaquinone biosynthesis C-methylase UbiE
MDDALELEFDLVAEWTAEVADFLGPDYYLPAACRGSGSPADLSWLIQQLNLRSSDRMLDCGAGVGGPAAFALEQVGVHPILTDPEAGACRAARHLFGLPVVRAATELPFASGSFDVAWCLGVLCTVDCQDRLLQELLRILAPNGRLGLLVFVAAGQRPPAEPEGNNFPTRDTLFALLSDASFDIDTTMFGLSSAAVPAAWQERADAVEAELDRRHRDSAAWRTAAHQSEIISRLLAANELAAQLVVAHRHSR